MARGWESKSVESQIEDRAAAKTSGARHANSAEERDREQRRSGLETSRRRIARELENAKSEVHRSALQNALTFLDDQISKL